jgi:hypothetical protein
MCHANTKQNSNNENNPNSWQQDAQAQERLYPNLDQILNNLLPENQSQFLRNFFAGNDAQTGPSAPPEPNQNPSAPPPPPPPQENQGNRNPQSDNQQWNQNQNQWNWQNWNQWNHPCDYSNMQSQPRTRSNSNGNENTNDLRLLFQHIGQRFAMNFVKSLGFLAMLLPILMAPKFLLVLGIFSSILKSFGIPIAPLVLIGISWEILTALDPILITVLAFWTIYKTWICGKPLIDFNYWRSRINNRCHSN